MSMFKLMRIFQTLKLIGLQRAPFQELKTKEHAVHAGHLQQLLLVNHGHYYKRRQLIFQNSNSSTVLSHMALMAATVGQESWL